MGSRTEIISIPFADGQAEALVPIRYGTGSDLIAVISNFFYCACDAASSIKAATSFGLET
jgi:hypothetical protein